MTAYTPPATLQEYVAWALPRLIDLPPRRSDWTEAIARKFKTTEDAVWAEVRAWKPIEEPPKIALGPSVAAPPEAPSPAPAVPLSVPVVERTPQTPVVARTPEARAPLDTQHPFDRVLNALRARGGRILPKRDSRGRESVRALCPAHDDVRPSLIITRENDRVLLKCFGNCRTSKVAAALNLRMSDLFSRPERPAARQVVATYDYYALDGTQLGQKIRFAPKGFRWRQHSPAVGLYRLPDLIDTRIVFLTEGEKACDRLWSMGLAATCGPGGAGSWKPDWSHDLWTVGCRELLILADNDQAGRAHAERVATATTALDVDDPIAVKVVTLPGLPYGGDIVDWFESGHTEELDALVAVTPTWSPERVAQERDAHQKALRKARNRRHRDKKRQAFQTARAKRRVYQSRPDIRTVSPPAVETQRMSASDGETRETRDASERTSSTSQKEVSTSVPLDRYPEARTYPEVNEYLEEVPTTDQDSGTRR